MIYASDDGGTHGGCFGDVDPQQRVVKSRQTCTHSVSVVATTSVAQRDDLIAIAGANVEGQQLILLLDPHRQTLGSYQVDAKTGQIALRSVRNIRWDLEMDEFNGTEPSPEKIQALLRSR